MKESDDTTNTTTKRFAISEAAPESLALVNALRDKPPGTTVSYADLAAIVGADVQVAHRSWLESARRRLLTDYGQRWDTVRKEGVKHLSDSEVAKVAIRDVQTVRRHSARAIRRNTLGIKDFGALSEDEQARQQVALSLLTLAHRSTAPKVVAKVEVRVREAKAALPVRKLLEIFG